MTVKTIWAWAILVGLFVLCIIGQCGCSQIPDQGQFAPLESLRHTQQPLVRLYGAKDPLVPNMLRHSWFVTKRGPSPRFLRWEIWITKSHTGHLWVDKYEPEESVYGLFDPVILAEVQGAAAEPIITAIENSLIDYPYKDEYALITGPNCHTYTLSICEKAGWGVPLEQFSAGAAHK